MFRLKTKARNNLAHYLPFDSAKAERAYLHKIDISQTLEMSDLEMELRRLKDDSFGAEKIKKNTTKRAVKTKTGNKERLYDNTEIQEKITEKAKTLSDAELEILCNKDYSKQILDINYALFVRVPKNSSTEERQSSIKDDQGYNRWPVRYEFSKNGYSYFVTTMWYPRNDEYVKRWLNN